MVIKFKSWGSYTGIFVFNGAEIPCIGVRYVGENVKQESMWKVADEHKFFVATIKYSLQFDVQQIIPLTN